MSNEDSLPVFVFPTQLVFYVKDASTHRHIITVYNPYDFVVNFQIMCTAPGNYSVVEPQGVIKPRCCVDVTIRRLNLSAAGAGSVPAGRPDKLRVCVRRRDRPASGGVRDVTAELFLDRRQRDWATLRSATETLAATGSATASASDAATTADFGAFDDVTMRRSTLHRQSRGGAGRSGWPLVLVAGLCILCLGAPGPDSDWLRRNELPDWLALSTTQKLVAAYVLGLVTSALLLQQ